MKLILTSMVAAAGIVLCGSTARAHGDEYCDDENYYDQYRDHVTQTDHYNGADVIHYDHHHRYLYTDEYGNVIGERVVHHDHHYVVPRHRHYRRVGWFLGF